MQMWTHDQQYTVSGARDCGASTKLPKAPLAAGLKYLRNIIDGTWDATVASAEHLPGVPAWYRRAVSNSQCDNTCGP